MSKYYQLTEYKCISQEQSNFGSMLAEQLVSD